MEEAAAKERFLRGVLDNLKVRQAALRARSVELVKLVGEGRANGLRILSRCCAAPLCPSMPIQLPRCEPHNPNGT